MSYKVPVCRRQDYTIYLQDIEGTTWAHCDVRRWSKAIARALTADADTVFDLHGGPMYALNEPTGCAKHQKFLKLMGFSFAKKLTAEKGELLIFRRGQHGA